VNKAEVPLNQKGFELFKANKVRRINPTHFLVKTENGLGSYLVELHEGKWVCDCDQKSQECQHRYAVRLAAVSEKFQEEPTDSSRLVCRYCGSPDISRCGFRYNSYGISRRYKCNECLRKFSVKYTNSGASSPSEMMWLIAEIGMVLTKVEELIDRILVTRKEPTDELRLKSRPSHQEMRTE
jgi:transposase-like protein